MDKNQKVAATVLGVGGGIAAIALLAKGVFAKSGTWEGGTWQMLPIENVWDLEDYEPTNPIIQNTAEIKNLKLVPHEFESAGGGIPPFVEQMHGKTIFPYQFLIPDWNVWTPASWVINLGYSWRSTVGYPGYSDSWGHYGCHLGFEFVLISAEDLPNVHLLCRWPPELQRWDVNYGRLGVREINTGSRVQFMGLGKTRGESGMIDISWWERVPLGDYILLAVAKSTNAPPEGLMCRHVFTLMEISVTQDPPEIPQ